MHIRWHEIDHRLRGVDGLDDVLSIDLNFLIRQMQPPVEQQYRHVPCRRPLYCPHSGDSNYFLWG